MVTSNMNLIYSYLIYPIERTYYRLRGCNLREVVARWFFVCDISERYTGLPKALWRET